MTVTNEVEPRPVPQDIERLPRIDVEDIVVRVFKVLRDGHAALAKDAAGAVIKVDKRFLEVGNTVVVSPRSVTHSDKGWNVKYDIRVAEEDNLPLGNIARQVAHYRIASRWNDYIDSFTARQRWEELRVKVMEENYPDTQKVVLNIGGERFYYFAGWCPVAAKWRNGENPFKGRDALTFTMADGRRYVGVRWNARDKVFQAEVDGDIVDLDIDKVAEVKGDFYDNGDDGDDIGWGYHGERPRSSMSKGKYVTEVLYYNPSAAE